MSTSTSVGLLAHSIDAATRRAGRPSRYYRNKRKSSKAQAVFSLGLLGVSLILFIANV